MGNGVEEEITAIQTEFIRTMAWLRNDYLPSPLPEGVENRLGTLVSRFDALREPVEEREATAAFTRSRDQESVPDDVVGQWETGGGPATDRLVSLADLLGVSLDYLLGQSKDSKRQEPPDDAIEQDLLLLVEARRLGVDLRSVVAEARQQRWIEENRGVLEDANAFPGRHGLWSDGKRQF
jgi:hypothetical protein